MASSKHGDLESLVDILVGSLSQTGAAQAKLQATGTDQHNEYSDQIIQLSRELDACHAEMVELMLVLDDGGLPHDSTFGDVEAQVELLADEAKRLSHRVRDLLRLCHQKGRSL